MADDLVAELVLRIRNEMNGGVDELRAELTEVQDSAQALAGEFAEVLTAIAELKGTEQLQAQMQQLAGTAAEVGGSLDDVTKALSAMPQEIAQATAAATAFGEVVDQDAAKVQAMVASWKIPDMIPPDVSGQNNPGFIPPGTTPPPPPGGEPDDEPDEPGAPRAPRPRAGGRPLEAEKHSGGVGNWIVEALALASGYEGEKDYAKMQETALQIAIIEGYSGKGALDQSGKIMHESYNQAYLSRGNVDDIEEAYFNLIRQQLPRTMVDQMMGPLSEAATTYGTPIADLTQPLFNLADQFKLRGDQMALGVGMLGAASHMGHYYFSDFSQGLPAVANQFERMGDTGLSGEATAAAALEMVRKGTPDSGSASTDLAYLMTYMTSPMAIRFFDRSKRSKELLGPNITELFDKYHIDPLDIPQFLDSEREHGVDPLNAMVDYMHSIGAGKMTPTDQAVVFNSLFHSVEASTAMQALVGHYDQFKSDQATLMNTDPGFLDKNFNTAIQGDSGGMSQLDLLGTYMYRLYGQNTWGMFGDTSGAPSQATLNTMSPGSSAFNIPINLTVNVDKSGNATATAAPAFGATRDGGLMQSYLPAPPGVSLRVNQGNVLNTP